MKFKALVFDFDGLIVDTETPDVDSWREVFLAHGCPFPDAEWDNSIGARADVFDPCAYLEARLGRRLPRETIVADRRARFHALAGEAPLRPGIAGYFEDAKQLGLALAVASSADRPWVTGHLARVDVLALFDAIRTIEDVAQAKPAPDLFLAVLEALGIAPAEALVFEDSPNGILAAQRAGIACVAVPNPVTAGLCLDGAGLRIESFEGTPLPEVLAHFDGSAGA